jgi:hypothetical protein
MLYMLLGQVVPINGGGEASEEIFNDVVGAFIVFFV